MESICKYIVSSSRYSPTIGIWSFLLFFCRLYLEWIFSLASSCYLIIMSWISLLSTRRSQVFAGLVQTMYDHTNTVAMERTCFNERSSPELGFLRLNILHHLIVSMKYVENDSFQVKLRPTFFFFSICIMLNNHSLSKIYVNLFLIILVSSSETKRMMNNDELFIDHFIIIAMNLTNTDQM